MSQSSKIEEAVSLSVSAGYHLDKGAFSFLTLLSNTEDPAKLIRAVLRKLDTCTERPLFIDRSLLEETAQVTLAETSETLASPISDRHLLSTGKTEGFQPLAKEVERKVEVLKDPSHEICSAGSVEGYLDYFRDRFKRIAKLLRQRMDSRTAVSIKHAFKLPHRSRAKTICMITEIRTSKYGVFLNIEDLDSRATVLIPSNAPPELLKKANSMLPDQVVCLGILKGRKNWLIVEELHFPDIPQRKPHRAREAVSVALISDLHVGSREFMREEFNRFVLWLNGKFGDRVLRQVAGRVKYVIIGGDVVDGVGVYPGQVEELNVTDIFEQYNLAAKLIEQIPDYVQLIVIPGNHDASRKALPQPSLPKEYAEPLYNRGNLLSLGNPATVSIHGVEFLLYHGRSLDDLLATAVDMDFHSPERAMRLLLQSRHLAPVYGKRTPIAPEKQDHLVIERIPDVFHSGHVHVMKHESYRGCLVINSGAWQRQTSYQRNLGLRPTPAIIPVVDLQTLSVLPIDFNL